MKWGYTKWGYVKRGYRKCSHHWHSIDFSFPLEHTRIAFRSIFFYISSTMPLIKEQRGGVSSVYGSGWADNSSNRSRVVERVENVFVLFYVGLPPFAALIQNDGMPSHWLRVLNEEKRWRVHGLVNKSGSSSLKKGVWIKSSNLLLFRCFYLPW